MSKGRIFGDVAPRRPKMWQVGSALAVLALVGAACGSSSPTAKKSSGTTTTTSSGGSTTTSSTPGGSTTTTSAGGASTGSGSGSSGGSNSGGGSSGSSCGNVVSASCDTQVQSASITGAGSTFDQPLFARAFYTYNQQTGGKVNVSYAAVGSGTGISDIQSQTVDFGATDVPLSPPSGNGGAILEIPVALGGVAMAYNLPGVSGQLKFTAQNLVDIYMGRITQWNDGKLTANNPQLSGVNQAIVTVHRADSSGTSYIFTDYLNHVDSTWSSTGPGVSKSPAWTKGASGSLGGNGNPGVAADVANTQYSIGYVELAYALQGNIAYGQVQNQAGSFVTPSLSSVSAAASQFPNVSYQNFSIVNAPGAGSYPIAGYSWGLVYQNQSNQAKGIALGKLLDWESSTGQSAASSIGYAPLPANIQALAHNTILQMMYGGKPLFNG